MWQLAVVFYLTLIVRVYSQNKCDVLLPQAQIYCVSPTEFTVDPPIYCNVTRFSCPDGLFCADSPPVCIKEGSPACQLSRACNACPQNALATCVGQKQYSLCNNGMKDSIVKTCQASKPFCSMVYDAKGNIGTVCTNEMKDMACNNICPTDPTPTEPPVTEPPPPAKECCDARGFKVTVDITGKGGNCGCKDNCGCAEEPNVDITVSVRAKNGVTSHK